MEFDWVEWLGYLASFVVLISLTMSSIIKLRWINLLGCLLFAYFGYRISSPPVLFANLGIAAINVYFLYKIYSTREEFKIINAATDSDYYRHFLAVNSREIGKQIPMARSRMMRFLPRRHPVISSLISATSPAASCTTWGG